ncbi:MAG TPA: hypothetical protein VM617_04685 [Thermoanaerobaculia bacterium]|nr:hypothetical protein [Thermoanaerobaculia bacterium]
MFGSGGVLGGGVAKVSAAADALLLLTAVVVLPLGGCRSAPTAGHGDIAFRLLWEGESDLDLHVIDTAGEELFFGHPRSGSGGRLDVDCNAGRLCAQPIENVFWPLGTAPAGRYRVWVRGHSVIPAEAPVKAALLVLQGERVEARREGTLAADGDTLGPFTVDFPPAKARGLRLVEIDFDDTAGLPWHTIECADGFRFRLQVGPRHALVELGGERWRLERGPRGSSIYSAEDILIVTGDTISLSTMEAQHGGCQPVN